MLGAQSKFHVALHATMVQLKMPRLRSNLNRLRVICPGLDERSGSHVPQTGIRSRSRQPGFPAALHSPALQQLFRVHSLVQGFKKTSRTSITPRLVNKMLRPRSTSKQIDVCSAPCLQGAFSFSFLVSKFLVFALFSDGVLLHAANDLLLSCAFATSTDCHVHSEVARSAEDLSEGTAWSEAWWQKS
ncbi:hypothetical protein BKA80DRAFT_120206 [Phyllosticta citrichinensis]